MRCILVLLLVIAGSSGSAWTEEAMTPATMIAIIDELSQDVEVDGPMVRFVRHQTPVVLIHDVAADRMRLVSPIIAVSDVSEAELVMAMQANFHNALDARYAISNDLVWSAFIHPLSSLDEDLFRSAIDQVVVARNTFGEEYTSGTLAFAP